MARKTVAIPPRAITLLKPVAVVEQGAQQRAQLVVAGGIHRSASLLAVALVRPGATSGAAR